MPEPNANTPEPTEAPKQPTVDNSPEGQAKQAVNFALKNPDSVPAKFKREDGTVDGDALLNSYLNMERRMSGAEPVADPTPAPEADSVTETLEQPKPESEGEEPKSLADALEEPEAPKTSDLWQRVEKELVEDGKISEATLAGLRENGVPESMIALAQEGRKAKAASDMQAAYDAVGGKEEFESTMKWAKQNLHGDELKGVIAGLKSPQSIYVLQGLHARAVKATTGSGQVNTGEGASPTVPAGQNANVRPFGSFQEQMAALKDKRYISNEDGFRDMVDMRIMAGAGHDPRNLRVG